MLTCDFFPSKYGNILQNNSSKSLCIIGTLFLLSHSAKIHPKTNILRRKSEYKNAQENASERKPKLHHPPNWYLMDEKKKQVDDIVGGDCESRMLILCVKLDRF
jgi:hypothetical protein